MKIIHRGFDQLHFQLIEADCLLNGKQIVFCLLFVIIFIMEYKLTRLIVILFLHSNLTFIQTLLGQYGHINSQEYKSLQNLKIQTKQKSTDQNLSQIQSKETPLETVMEKNSIWEQFNSRIQKNLLKEEKESNIIHPKVKSRQLQENLQVHSSQYLSTSLIDKSQSYKKSSSSMVLSTNCSINICTSCVFRQYKIKTIIYDFQTDESVTVNDKKYYEVCQKCEYGYFPYMYQKVKSELDEIQNNGKDGEGLQKILKQNMGKLQSCQANNYKVYEANLVIDSVDVQNFKKNKAEINKQLARLLSKYKAQQDDVNIVFVRQGSIILDFWVKIDKKYVMDSSVISNSQEQVLQGDIMSFKIEQIARKTQNNSLQSSSFLDVPVESENNQSFQKLLLPIIIAGALSGVLIAVVIYFVCIRKRNVQEESKGKLQTQNQELSNEQHNTSIMKPKTRENPTNNQDDRMKSMIESVDDLLNVGQTQKTLGNAQF